MVRASQETPARPISSASRPPATSCPLLGFFIASANLATGGIPVTVTVFLNGRAPIGGATITLSSNNAAVTVPQNITVPAGATSATFVANTTPVSSAVVANITGSYAGARTGLALTIYPAISSLQALPATINAGGTTNTAQYKGVSAQTVVTIN